MQIEPVDERSTETRAVLPERFGHARTSTRAVSTTPARARVRRPDQHGTRRKCRCPMRARQHDPTVFERLAQRLECASSKLRDLVEKQDSVVGEANLSRPRLLATSDERDVAERVMWCAKRPYEGVTWKRRAARKTVDRDDVERFVSRKRRQDARQPSREHRLSRAWRPDEEEVVTTSRGNLQRATCRLLPAHVGQVVDDVRAR